MKIIGKVGGYVSAKAMLTVEFEFEGDGPLSKDHLLAAYEAGNCTVLNVQGPEPGEAGVYIREVTELQILKPESETAPHTEGAPEAVTQDTQGDV